MSGLPPSLAIEGRIATITLRRPALANRLSLADLDALCEQVAEVDLRRNVLVLVLAAEGRHFCSGFDVGSLDAGAAAGGVRFEALATAIAQARPVTVARLQGGSTAAPPTSRSPATSGSVPTRPSCACRRRASDCISTPADSPASCIGWACRRPGVSC